MPRTKCCCDIPREDSFCCDPVFFTDFITLFGSSMAESAVVSPKDWVALYVPRPGTRSTQSTMISTIGQGDDCNCCCSEINQCPPNGTAPATEFVEQQNTKREYFKNKNFGSRSDVFYKNTNIFQTAQSQETDNDIGVDIDPPTVPPTACPTCGNEVEPTGCNQSIFDDPIADQRCACGCCSRYLEKNLVDGAAPIIYAYKYSGCNLTWHPREYTFNYNPYIAQCTGFLSNISPGQGGGIRQVSCQPFAEQPTNRGGAPYQSECDISGSVGYSYRYPLFPCGCVPFPHIHGGVYDSLYNRVNVSLNRRQMGYVPFMAPFPSPMLASEKGCCWCANSNRSDAGFEEGYLKNRQSIFTNTFPYFDQQGKRPGTPGSSTGLPGTNCFDLTDQPGFNPNYNQNCFARGISPYLLRVAAKQHKLGFEIWGYGQNNNSRYYFGPSYEASEVTIKNLQKDIEISFRKVYGKKTKLLDQFVGIINLEHHFECYTYRSEEGSSSVEIQAVQNHCSVLIGSFEGYGGRISGGTNSTSGYRWTPWKYDSIMWQTRRGVPRRAIYAGSAIPLFHFDLVRMEEIVEKNNITGEYGDFDGKLFLSHYYRYFYSLIYFQQNGCESPGDIPGPPEWDFSHLLNSYNYVVYWTKMMIKQGIIRIKDHAIDIAQEVNTLVRSGTYDQNGDVVIPFEIAEEVGGLVEYKKILDLFGVCAGNQNAIKPIDVKNKLLNQGGLEESLLPDGSSSKMNLFLPRRAVLPNFDSIPGITGWLESSKDYLSVDGREDLGFTGAAYSSVQTNVPWIYNIEDPENIFNQVLSPQRVICGLGANFVVDASGKLTVFGAEVEQEPFNCSGFPQFPSGVGCVPWYLGIQQLFTGDDFPINPTDDYTNLEAKEFLDVVDGRVVDLAFKGKNFVVALADFNSGGIGPNCILPQGNIQDPAVAYENIETDNINGNNIKSASEPGCLYYEPFGGSDVGQAGAETPPFRIGEQRAANAYRLKSWGSKALEYGTFALSQKQQSWINETYGSQSYPNRTYSGQNRRYPGTNTWWIWTAVGGGMKHFAAIDDYGGVFIPPQSDNSYGQSSKGLGALDDDSTFGGLHEGFGARFNYFPHIPRPGYVKEEEWNQQFYNDITLKQSCYKKYSCACHFSQSGVNGCLRGSGDLGGGGGDSSCTDCSSPVTVGMTCYEPIERAYDLTCVLMGKLSEYVNEVGERFELLDNPGRPQYTKVACGHYNTLLLTNENKLEMYGKFVKIDDVGEVIPIQQPVDVFVPPTLLSKAGSWGVTYACPLSCNGITHTPILEATYNSPQTSNEIIKIDSSNDYAVAVTNDNVIHIWGDKSMIPGLFDPLNYQSGQTGYSTISLNDVVDIESIGLGVNAFYIYYKQRVGQSIARRVYSFTRYNLNIGTKFPEELQNTRIVDLDAGYIHGIAIYSKRELSLGWNPNAFAKINTEDTQVDSLNYQFNNFASLPAYFKRQAFFHAVPGSWDYSKWLYGGIGCNAFSGPTPFEDEDLCSALSYNIYLDPAHPNYRNIKLSRSGNPHLFWMRKDWRRSTFQSLSLVIDNGGGESNQRNKCRPDNGIAIAGPGGNFGAGSSSLASCFSNYGPVWGYGRPLANTHRRVIRTNFDIQCIAIPCSIPTQYEFINRTICDNVPYAKEGVDIPPTNAYRSTKDVFQLLWSLFDYRSPFSSCPGLIQQFHSYFKYSERHYYFGYDEEDGAWKIYENPDFLGSINPLVVQPCEEDEYDYDFEAGEYPATGADLCDILCDPCGFGGGFTFTGPSGYTGSGFTGSGLKNYPRTSSNYARESDVELPAWLITTASTAVVHDTVCGILNSIPSTQNPNEPLASCSTCFGNQDASRAAFSYGGPGAFYWWGVQCNGPLNFQDRNGAPVRTTLPLPDNRLYSASVYNRKIKRTLSAKELLYGVSDGLKPDIDPKDDPNYQNDKKTFIQVLKDPTYTETSTPWLFGGSFKWIPICWNTPIYLPNIETPTIDNTLTFFFDNSEQENANGILQRNFDFGTSTAEVLFDFATANSEQIICTPFKIEEIASFVLYSDAFMDRTIRESLLEFTIPYSLTYESNITKLFAKIYKLTATGEEIFLQDSDYSDILATSGIDGTAPHDPYSSQINTAYFTANILNNIQLQTGEKLLIRIMTRYSNCYYNSQVKLTLYFGLTDKTAKLFYTRYDNRVPESNQICFIGADGPEADNLGNDPNAVIYKVTIDPADGTRIYTVATAPIVPTLFLCCPVDA